MMQLTRRRDRSGARVASAVPTSFLRPAAVRIPGLSAQRTAAFAGMHSQLAPLIQAKLAVGSANDQYEQEADRVAEQIVRMPESALTAPATLQSSAAVQRKCACGGTGDDECSCGIQRKAQPEESGGSHDAPQIVNQVLGSAGQPLGPDIRAYMEPRFGRDFSHVRVHTDSRAAESAGAVDALAYTVGQDIGFASGKYSSSSESGRRLLAHELAHVIQQDWSSRLASSGGVLQRQDAGTPPKQMPAPTPIAATPGSGGLCSEHPDESFYQNSPFFCRDTSGSGALHSGHTCYREIPTGSVCPPGKHICFTEGKCDEKESHIDSTAPSIRRDSQGFCDLSWFGGCSFEHLVLDVIPGLVTEAAQAQADAQEQCMKSCETLPWYAKGFCMSGCTPMPF